MGGCGMAVVALLPLLLLAPRAVVGVEEECVTDGDMPDPEPPASLVEHRVSMAYDKPAERTAAFTVEEMVTARELRHEVRTFFETRSSVDADNQEIELSARFCGLEYPECPAAAWKPAGLECADVVPVQNQNCTDTEMEEYTIAILLPSAFWIALGVTIMVLNALWYLMRCCKLFGGMKAGKGLCCMKYYSEEKAMAPAVDENGLVVTVNDPGSNGEPPDYLLDPKCKGQLGIFRAWFTLMFLLIFIAALLGGVGNGLIGTGIDDSIEILFFDMKSMFYRVDNLMNEMSRITQDNDEVASQVAEVFADGQNMIRCLNNDIKTMEADLAEAKDSALSLRSLATNVVIAIPLVIAVVYVVSMYLKVKFLACCSNVWAWVLLLIVCLSAALHGVLAFVFADICYEVDLHLATYYLQESPKFGDYEKLNFLPPEAADFCGPDGSLAFVEGQFDAQMDASVQMGIDFVSDACNPDPVSDSADFMDCSQVDILEECSPQNPCEHDDDLYGPKQVACTEETSSMLVPAIWTSTNTWSSGTCSDSTFTTEAECIEAGRCNNVGNESPDDATACALLYTVPCGWAYWNSIMGGVPNQLMIRNVDLVDLNALDTNDASGSDDIMSCLEARGWDPLAGDPLEPQMYRDCYLETDCGGTCQFITFRACATDCINPTSKTETQEVVAKIEEATTMVGELEDLLKEKAMPLLRCTFVSEMFADLFIPLCVDAVGGFGVISIANGFSFFALIISFPVGVMATKRLVKKKVSPEVSYIGTADDGAENTTEDTQPLTNPDPHVVQTTQLM